MEDKKKEKPKTFKELITGYEGDLSSEEWDTGKPVGEEDIYRKEYMQTKANFRVPKENV